MKNASMSTPSGTFLPLGETIYNNSRSVSLTNNDKIYGYHGRQKQIILENITDSYDQCGNFDATCFSVLMS